MFGQTPGNDLQESQGSTRRKRDAKEVPRRTFRHFLKVRGEKKEGRFSEWCSKASGKGLRGLAWGLCPGRVLVCLHMWWAELKSDTMVGFSQVTECGSPLLAKQSLGWDGQGWTAGSLREAEDSQCSSRCPAQMLLLGFVLCWAA
ncbi:hypothetical protein HJG60_011537 [Phyllostomus discolor]|uniref:Uncharacterized protein n=1 Tax=Phyllostomus discolor TaxID=89673 RepID=A0A834DXF1_9CHIR|nr:hypothetical protein HJG60_011537 [Phyllostomus discolor]